MKSTHKTMTNQSRTNLKKKRRTTAVDQSKITTVPNTDTLPTTETQPTSASSGIKRPLEESTPIDLTSYNDATELEALGLEALKGELARLGLKIGGTLKQRAERLWATKGLTSDLFPSSIKASSLPMRHNVRVLVNNILKVN